MADLTAVASGVLKVTMRHPRGEPLPDWEPGAHVDLVLGPGLVRQYSLCGDPADRTTWTVAVLLEPESRGGSRYVHQQLVAGAVLDVRGPRNHFPLLSSPRYVFVAGGIGITPLVPMIAAAEAAGSEWQLLYGGRQRSSMAFVEELQKGYRSRVTVCPQDESGLLDLASVLDPVAPGTLVYCCGPEPLLAAVERHCVAWPAGSLHVERFALKPAEQPVLTGSFDVELAVSGLTVTVPPEKSILQVAEEAGAQVFFSCEEGTCGTCETRVLDGVPDHRDSILTDEEQAANDVMMICVSRSATPRLVIEL